MFLLLALALLSTISYADVCNADWKSNAGSSCQAYMDEEWCTASGAFGAKWLTEWGPFAQYAVNGEDASVCPQCGCSEFAANLLGVNRGCGSGGNPKTWYNVPNGGTASAETCLVGCLENGCTNFFVGKLNFANRCFMTGSKCTSFNTHKMFDEYEIVAATKQPTAAPRATLEYVGDQRCFGGRKFVSHADSAADCNAKARADTSCSNYIGFYHDRRCFCQLQGNANAECTNSKAMNHGTYTLL